MSKIWIINQYTSTPETGMGGRHHYLAQALTKLGHEVFLVGARRHHLLFDDAISDAAPIIEKRSDYTFVRIDVPKYPNATSPKRILNWLLFSYRLRKLPKMLGHTPDAVLYSSPSILGFQGAAKLAKKCRARLVFEVRDIWPLTLKEVGGHSAGHPLIRYMQHVEDGAYRKADAVISNLPNAALHMMQRGMAVDKFTWVPNGFSQDEIATPLPLTDDVIDMLPKDKFIIGYAGTLGTANALTTVIDAADRLRDRTDITFVLVGQGRDKAALEAEIANRKLTNIHMIPPVPKKAVQSMLTRFDVCYIGLTRDPLFRFGVSPNKLFDYLVSGKPIIYGIDSGEYQPVKDLGAGIQIPPEDGAALAQAAVTMSETSPADRQKMGASGLAGAISTYEYNSLGQKLEKVLLADGDIMKL